jgi:hypothetical protein
MFKLMVPCGYLSGYRLEGPVGGTPDVRLIHLDEQCCRFTLPPFLDSLVFNFVDSSGSGVRVQNFYHLGDFFVVSDTLKGFMEVHAGCAFDAKKICTKHAHDEDTGQFWAMKVMTRVDCILPDQSFAQRPFWSPESVQPFKNLPLEVKLSADISPYFANRGPDTYYSYPSLGVRSVSMDFSAVPQGVKIFEPSYWPKFLVIDRSFADALERQCRGGAAGYYFWTLGFDDVSNEYNKTMLALR